MLFLQTYREMMISEQYTKTFMVRGENTWKSRKSKSLSQLSQQIKEADLDVGGRRLTRHLSLSLMNVDSQANCGLQIKYRKSIKS